MKSASAGLIALLNGSAPFYMADLYTFTLADRTIYRYTSADIDVDSGGHTFSSRGPLFTRGRTKTTAGIEVDTLDVKIFANSTVTIGGVTWTAFAAGGGLDGARLQLERAFMPAWGNTSAGTLIPFFGRISDVQISRSEISIKVTSELDILNVNLPRNLFQPGCVHSVYDTGCTLLKSSFTVSGTCNSGSSMTIINTTLVQPDLYFDQGVITFTSGANNGLSRTVREYSHANAQLALVLPLPIAPSAADTFNIYPGCDKTQPTCDSKFSNKAHFKGFRFIPVPETST